MKTNNSSITLLRDFISIQSTLQYKALCVVFIMNEEQDLKKIERGSFREFMQDGFTEMMAGTVFLVFPLLIIEPAFVPIFVVFYIFFLPHLLEVVRKKHVYPRIGYVKLREDEPPKVTVGVVVTVILMIAAGIILVYAILIDLINSEMVYRWVPAFFGVIMWAPSAYLKDKTGQNRYYLFGALMTITGFALALTDFLPVGAVNVVYSLSWGAAFFVLGIIRAALFIRKYPVIESPEDGSGEQ